MSPWPFLLPLSIPMMLVAGALLRGPYVFLPVLLLFVLLPLLDERVGDSAATPEAASARWLFDLPILAWVVAQLGVTAFVLQRLVERPHTPIEIFGLLLALGVLSGAGGITVAHELMHRSAAGARGLAEILMTAASYPHFCVEHVLGHHRHVATPQDAASARLGESLPRFLWRCLPGSLLNAWRLERERAARVGLRRLDLRDRRWRHPVMLAASYALVFALLGPFGLALFVAQGLVAVLLLETVNYLEHYGLQRRELAPGRFERVGPEHSWNSGRRLSNWYLFNLARHADHHALASAPYERLRHLDQAPQLPAGYATMLLVALVPPLFFRVMDPRVRVWRERAAATRP